MVTFLVQAEGEYLAFGLSTDAKPLAPLDGCLFVEIDTNNMYYPSGGAWVLSLRQRVVKAVTDFPPPAGGVITLEDNMTYVIQGAVDIGLNRLVCGTKNSFVGRDRINDILTSSTSGTMFTCDSSIVPKSSLAFNNITVSCPNGALFNFTSNVANQNLWLMHVIIGNVVSLGTLNNFNLLTLANVACQDTVSTNGFSVTGVNKGIRLQMGMYANNAGTFLNLGSSVQDFIDVNNCYVSLSSGQVFCSSSIAGANINQAGKISNNIKAGVGTFSSGFDESTILWRFTDNIGINNNVLSTVDIEDSLNKRFVTDYQRGVLLNTSGTNTGDQDLSDYFNTVLDDADSIADGAINNFVTPAERVKIDYLTVTSNVNLDTIAADTIVNNAKVSNATHTGEIVGSTSLVLDKSAISNRALVTPANGDKVLVADESDSDNLKYVTALSLANLATSTVMREVELAFGSVPTVDKSFTITDSGATTSSNIMVLPSGNPASGRQGVDFAVDAVQFTATPANGQFTIYALCTNGHITGNRKVFYLHN